MPLGYGSYHINIGDLLSSLMSYMWRGFVPAMRARGFPARHCLDVSETVAETGQTVKVTVAQNMTATNLADGGTRSGANTPPAVADVSLTEDFVVTFGITDFLGSMIAGQPTQPAMFAGAIAGLLNAIESTIVADLIANVPVANVIGTLGTALTGDDLRACQNMLVQNYAPPRDYRALLAPTPGAWGKFIQEATVVYAQERGWKNGESGRESPIVQIGDTYGQEVQWNGGVWTQSQLVPYPSVSGTVQSANVVFDRAALAIAIRPPKLPTAGLGAIARNFVDPVSGIALQMLLWYNGTQYAEEMTVRTLFGDAAAQPLWSALLNAA
jgi:hypothetical protein